MYDRTHSAPIRPSSAETLPGLNDAVENGLDAMPAPEGIQFEQDYSVEILRYLQSTEEGIIGVPNARGRLMKEAGLPYAEKGARIEATRSLHELEKYKLIQVIGDRNHSPTRIKSIIPTELGLAYQLPPKEEAEE